LGSKVLKEKKIEHLSKSSIKEMLQCGFKFYNHQLRSIRGPTPYYFTRGSGMHDTLHESIVEGKDTVEYREQVNYVKAVMRKLQPYSVVVAEKRMEAYFQDLKLVGLMDLVVRSGDKVIILDYKSGSERPFRNYRFELAIYKYILQENGVEATHWGIIFPDKKTVKVEAVKQDEVDKALAKAYQAWLDVENRRFERNLKACRFCDLKKQCDTLWYEYNEYGKGKRQTQTTLKG